MNKVTFCTQCREKDWEIIIKNNGFTSKINNINFIFNEKILLITNILNKNIIKKYIINLINNKYIDKYFFCDEIKDIILNYFSINESSFNGGLWYSIGPLTAIFYCKSDYLVYNTADSICQKNTYNWVGEGIKLLNSNKQIKVISPVWNLEYDNAKNDQSFYEQEFKILTNDIDDKNWTYDFGFSDQCFLIKVEDFKKQIYNEINNLSEMFYPKHAGDSFEKRVSSYLKNNHFYRAVSQKTTYFHPKYL